MTKRFRKVRNFETRSFMQDFERELIEEEEGDIFTLYGLERARDDDQLSDAEDGFIAGYMEA
ncbi:hypothetical protein KY363_07940 [Candidatus Woesearchaeota archaeon]|nr:hypothetical protein [Candidatus Woesearchaeota archaeon]